jgi:hypothetical protein
MIAVASTILFGILRIMKNALINYEAKDWRRLHDNASAMAKNIPNISWSDPLMRIAQAAMEMEENARRCTCDAPPENKTPGWNTDPTP